MKAEIIIRSVEATTAIEVLHMAIEAGIVPRDYYPLVMPVIVALGEADRIVIVNNEELPE